MRILPHPTLARWLAATLAVIGWSALAIEFHFIMDAERSLRIAHAAVVFLGFFTIISNLLVAVVLTAFALRPAGRRAGRLGSQIAAAAVVYILVTGVVYMILLRQSHSNALGWAVDIALHLVIPVGYPLFWVAMTPRRGLLWKDACTWLILPLGFALASMVRGAVTGAYSYFFLNPRHVGYGGVALSVALLSLMFLAFGWIVVAVNRALVRRSDETR